MKETFFIIPGFRQSTESPRVTWLVKHLQKKGFKVYCVKIAWNNKTMADYIEQFKVFFNQHKSHKNYVLGFSYGAVISFMTATELAPSKAFLCSLSPDFKEDIKAMLPIDLRIIGKRRFQEVGTRSAIETAKELKIPSVVFYGEKEGTKFPQLKKRCEETARLAKNSKLVIVKDAPHDIGHPEYMKSIMRELDKLP